MAAPCRSANPDGGEEPVAGRSAHAAVALDQDLYVLAGDKAGDLISDVAVLDVADKQVRGGAGGGGADL